MGDGRIPMLILCVVAAQVSTLPAAEPPGPIELCGELSEPADLSGLALHNGLLVVCSDEGARLNVLRRKSPAAFEALPPIQLGDNDKGEIDMEGVASDGQCVFVVGSHSRSRKKLEGSRAYTLNRRRLTEIDDEQSRYNIFRLRLGGDGACTARDSISLGKILENDEILAPFTKLPGKENGIDIEGIAAADGVLYLGFRGPVLRGNYVPVVVIPYDEPARYRLLFVDLAGRGIRDLAAAGGGLLILAGPVGDGDGSHELYFWNKQDCVPGEDAPRGKVVHVGTVESSADAKPEGIAVVEQTRDDVALLVLSDGATAPRAEQMRVKLPR